MTFSREEGTAISYRSRARRAFIFVAAAIVLVATLYPVDGPAGGGDAFCLICGDRGLSDALVNVILFIPLGAAAALTGRSTLTALAFGAALSCSVEVAQVTLIPGRDASLNDLVFNTLGAVVGVGLLKTARFWLQSSDVTASRLSLGAALFATGIVAGTGLLFAPEAPQGAYFVMWTPQLRNLDRYDAPIRSVTIGERLLPPTRIEQSAEVRELLEVGAPLRVDAVVAPSTPRPSAMFAIYDVLRRQVAFLGPDRDDLVFRIRMRAASASLDQPDLRVAGWGNLNPGADVAVTVRRSGRRYCVGLGLQPSCNNGFSAGMGWALFLYNERWPGWVRSALGVSWMGMLGFPVGFWARRRWESLAALFVLATAWMAVPKWVGLMNTPVIQVLGGIVGIGVGILLSRAIACHESRRDVARKQQ